MSIEKSQFMVYVRETIVKHPEWGNDIINATTSGMTDSIHELKRQVSISQMAAMNGAAFLIGKHKATKGIVELHEHILFKSMLNVDGIGDEVVDDAITKHCTFMKDWIDKLHNELHKEDDQPDGD